MSSWKRIKISDFLKEREGKYSPDDNKLAGLQRLHKIDFSGEICLSNKSSKTDMIIVFPGDLVISGINVAKGAIAVYAGTTPITATIHYSTYTFDKDKIDINFFKLFIKSPLFEQAIKEQVRSGIKTEIKPKHFLPLEIYLPDFKTQKEIVSFFGKIGRELNELNEEISNQTSLLQNLRQQILQDAIEGKLTAEWRKKHPDLITGENHASKLLEKIKAEKARLIQEGKLKKEKPLATISEAEKPFPLPDGWIWCRLGEISRVVNGSTPDKTEFKTEGLPFFKVYNIVNQKLDFNYRPQYITRSMHEGKLKRSQTTAGDLLMNIVGPPLGKLAIVPEAYPSANINQALIAIKPYVFLDVINPYLYFFFSELSEIGSVETKGVVGQDNISVTQARNFRIPLPSIAEQQAIVGQLDKLLIQIGNLQKQVAVRINQSEKLMQSVLREAFAPTVAENKHECTKGQ